MADENAETRIRCRRTVREHYISLRVLFASIHKIGSMTAIFIIKYDDRRGYRQITGGLIMRFQKWIGTFVSLLFIAGVIAMSGTSASAQRYGNRSWDGYPNWGGTADMRQTALNEGYNAGMKAGADDLARNRRS